MAIMQHRPCTQTHQHSFPFPLSAFFKTLPKHPKHPSKGRLQEMWQNKIRYQEAMKVKKINRNKKEKKNNNNSKNREKSQ